ncbi:MULTISPECIES: phytanoyl-CoA dioxygenase family protein [Spirulina sp. CCY15215]|uniref:phytanoyl-CoA dioxygenase family protein n=1 Tax=Spirulina sp. CCY15215 TaxID=2767591 RepID=UPI0019518A7E|nr:phytanoyl-CoA dioxygenase family protein [Spirulina major]
MSAIASKTAIKYHLTTDEIEQYRQQGFLGPFTAFSPEEMTPYREIICDRVLTTPSPFSPYQTQMRHLDSQTIWQLCSAPAIVHRLVSLHSADLIVRYSHLFDKPPAQPGQPQEEYPWHQDRWHSQLEQIESLGVWLAITPATLENGCVDLIPGTHTHAIKKVQNNNANFSGWFGGLCADPTAFNEADKVSMVLQPGQFFLFDERILHHSNPNYSRERRIGLTFRATLPSVKLERSHPVILLSGSDRSSVNPLIPPPESDPHPLEASALPDAAHFSLEQRISGIGWHLAEQDNNIGFRWMSERRSWLDLSWQEEGEGRLTCQILHAVSPEVLQSLEIRVCDRPVSLSWSQSDRFVVVETSVTAETLQQYQGIVRVSFHIAQTLRFCDLYPDRSNDTRELGLAIHSVSLVRSG